MASDIQAVHWVRPVRLEVVPGGLEYRARLSVAQRMAARGEDADATMEVLEMLGLIPDGK